MRPEREGTWSETGNNVPKVNTATMKPKWPLRNLFRRLSRSRPKWCGYHKISVLHAKRSKTSATLHAWAYQCAVVAVTVRSLFNENTFFCEQLQLQRAVWWCLARNARKTKCVKAKTKCKKQLEQTIIQCQSLSEKSLIDGISFMALSKNQIFYKRDNYSRWPWTAIIFACTVSGVLFLMAGKCTRFFNATMFTISSRESNWNKYSLELQSMFSSRFISYLRNDRQVNWVRPDFALHTRIYHLSLRLVMVGTFAHVEGLWHSFYCFTVTHEYKLVALRNNRRGFRSWPVSEINDRSS